MCQFTAKLSPRPTAKGAREGKRKKLDSTQDEVHRRWPTVHVKIDESKTPRLYEGEICKE